MHEIARWGAAMVALVGFGVAMGLNPALYGATADILARNRRVRVQLSWMVAGLAVGATILLAIFHSVDPTRAVDASRGELEGALVNRIVDLAAGAVFLIAAVVVMWWKMRVRALFTASESTAPAKPREHPFSYFLLGLGACIGFTTLPIMYLTGRLISGLTDDLFLRPVAYGVFLIALAAPFFSLAWVWMRFPALTVRITDFYGRAVHWDYRPALAGLLVVASFVFFALALFAHRGT